MNTINMSDPTSVVERLSPPFLLVPLTGAFEQLYALSSLFAVLLVLSLVALVVRWRHGHRVILTSRDGVIILGTTTLVLVIFAGFLCSAQVFLWKIQHVFATAARNESVDDLVPVWSTSWALLIIAAFVEVWGLWTAVNFRPGSLRRQRQSKLLIPAVPFNLVFGGMLAVFVALITTAAIYCTAACKRIAVATGDELNQAIHDCMFWMRFRDITLACSLLCLVIGELTAFVCLRTRLRAEIQLLEREHAGWHARRELLACEGGWAKFRDVEAAKSPSPLDEPAPTPSSAASSALPYSAGLAAPSPLHLSPSPRIGPMIVTRASGKEEIMCKSTPEQRGTTPTTACPGQRAQARLRVLKTLKIHAASLSFCLLCFFGVSIAQTVFIGSADRKTLGTILTLVVLWSVPVAGFPMLLVILVRSSADEGSFLGTKTLPVISQDALDEKEELDEDDDEPIVEHPFYREYSLGKPSGLDAVHVHLPPSAVSPREQPATSGPGSSTASSQGSVSRSSQGTSSRTSWSVHRLPSFTLGGFPPPARQASRSQAPASGSPASE